MSEIFDLRELGQYPLSIGTSLAIESLLGIKVETDDTILTDEQKERQQALEKEMSVYGTAAPIFAFDEVWVNLRTLVRNTVGAISTQERKQIKDEDLAATILSEMDVITTEINAVNKTQIVFYASDLDLGKYKNASIRVMTTPLQQQFEKNSVNAIGRIFNHYKRNPTDSYKLMHYKLKLEPDKNTKAVILTNFPIDLLCYNSFKELTLLESHTGALKKRPLWYTKYLNGSKLTRLPFTEKFLQIFGDKETFKPLDQKLRNDILALAEKYKWTPLTTSDKISYGINTLKNQYAVDFYRKL